MVALIAICKILQHTNLKATRHVWFSPAIYKVEGTVKLHVIIIPHFQFCGLAHCCSKVFNFHIEQNHTLLEYY
jgi:hypothetical protein